MKSYPGVTLKLEDATGNTAHVTAVLDEKALKKDIAILMNMAAYWGPDFLNLMVNAIEEESAKVEDQENQKDG